MNFHIRSTTAAALTAICLLAGCATLSPDADTTAVQTTANNSIAQLGSANAALQTGQLDDANRQAEEVAKLLQAGPLSLDNAMRIALLNNPGLAVNLAQLRISDADRVQAATLTNPHFSFMRAAEGDKQFLERGFGFNLFGLLAVPWRSKWQGQQHEQAKLAAAINVVKLAADTRKAWVNAVAAQQSADYAAQSKIAAEAAGELARRMARVGNWSKLNQAREQSLLADATAALAKAQNNAFAQREQLIRVLGLWGAQTQFELPSRLPDLPAALQDSQNLEQRALTERLDVRSAKQQTEAIAGSLNFTQAAGYINALDLRMMRETTTDTHTGDREKKRAWELELPIPIFDWGQAGNARAQATYMQSVAQLRATAINARSEVRQSWYAYRTAHDLAKHYQTEVMPLRKFISEQTLLRYNGMLLGVFELIADTRSNISAANASIDALRDFWLIETDLLLAISGTSPGAVSGFSASTGANNEAKGH